MTPEAPKPDPLPGNAEEERIGALINDYFDRRERGEAISAEEFLAQHAQDAPILREHLVGLDLLAGLGGSSAGGNTLPGAVPLKAGGSSAELPLGKGEDHLPNIPGYDLHKQIGRGGMGVVFRATQRSTKRVVALKLLLEGPFASDSTRRRFEREVSLAAQLKHPNIIPIYDSGIAEGRMYYAMEHIYGASLQDYLREHELDVRGKLRLFIKICAAISHAHQRGVIHRDLKPSNIIVDSDGEPHLLDFGLAKAGSLGDATTSITAQILGTPAYMSPEQASGDPTGIDVRSDVYSMGVVLYEALVGRMPYETNVSMGKILHNIAQAEPVLPSKANGKIDAEVSAILLKALEKLKEKRYQSIDGLSGDMQRYLDGVPITARPPDTLYLLRKAFARHRSFVVVTALILLVGTAGLLGARKYREALSAKEEQIRQTQQAKEELQQSLKEKEATLEEINRQRATAAQAVQQSTRLLEQQGGKAAAEITQSAARMLSKALAGDPAAIAELASAIPDLPTEAPDAPKKNLAGDSADPVELISRKPDDIAGRLPLRTVTQEQAAEVIGALAKLLEDAKRGAATQPAATTQANAPAQPASQPATPEP